MPLGRLIRHISGGLSSVKSELKQHLKSGLENLDEEGRGHTPDLILVLRASGGTSQPSRLDNKGHDPRVISRKNVLVPPDGIDPALWITDLLHVPASAAEACTSALEMGADRKEVAAAAAKAAVAVAEAAVPSEAREMREAANIITRLSELSPHADLTTTDGTLDAAKAVLKRIFGEDRFEVEEHPMCGDLIGLAIRWRDDRVLEFAEEVGYPVQIEPTRLKDLGIELDSPSVGYMQFRRAVQGFARLWPSDDGLLDERGSDGWQILQSIHRQRLLWEFALRWLRLHVWMRDQYIYDVVFPHCEWRLRRLRNFCERQTVCDITKPGSLDIDPIRNYFGGHYALYFAFCEYTYRWSLALFAISLGFNIAEYCFLDNNTVIVNLRMVFSIVLGFVGILFIELWARESNYWMARWGSVADAGSKSQTNKVICTDFEGIQRPAVYDSSQMVTVPDPGRRCRGLVVSVSIEVIFIIVVFTLVFGPYAYCIHHPDLRQHKATLNVVMSLLCQGIKIVWKNLAPALVPLEQHKFRHDADESVDRKTTIVNFVCLFAPLFYLVFVLPLAGWCTGDDSADADSGCVVKEEYRGDLQAALLTQLISEAMMCTKDVAIPIFFFTKRTLMEDNDMNESSPMEREFLLSEYDGYYLAQDYQQLLFPMAFVLLFGSLSRSLTTGTWLVLSWSQRKLDLWKLLHLYRRPMPVEVGDSGRSRGIFIRSISFFSGASNWAQIVGSYPAFANLRTEERIMVFLAGMYIITIMKNIVSATVPGKGEKTRLLEVRGHWQRLRVDAFFTAHQCGIGSAAGGSGWDGDEPTKPPSAATSKLDHLREKQKRLQELRAQTASLDAVGWRKERKRVAQEVAAFERAVAELEAVVPGGKSDHRSDGCRPRAV